jgi:hypothetical protein
MERSGYLRVQFLGIKGYEFGFRVQGIGLYI